MARMLEAFSSPRTLAVAMALSSVTASCSLVTDVERFKYTGGPNNGGSTGSDYQDLRFTMTAMKPHLTQYVEFRVIDKNNYIQCRGIVEKLVKADTTLYVKRAIPPLNGPYHLDWYADVNTSGGFDGLGSTLTNDHAWRIDPLQDFPAGAFTPVDGLVQIEFLHNTTFTNIDQYPSGQVNVAKDTSLPTTISFDGMEAYRGKLAEARIVEKQSGHVVGLYRVVEIDKNAFTATIPGSVEGSADYDVEVVIDKDGNGQYENPADNGDLGWRIPATADATGLNLAFNPTLPNSNVDVGQF